MKYSRGKWEPRKDYKDKFPSPLHLIARSRFDSIGTVFLTDPGTRKRAPEFAGNAALMLGAPEMYRILKKLVSSGGWMEVPLRRVSDLLEKIEKQAEELCPRN